MEKHNVKVVLALGGLPKYYKAHIYLLTCIQSAHDGAAIANVGHTPDKFISLFKKRARKVAINNHLQWEY